MTSPAKLAANLRNALKSTGPKTKAGKLIAAQNALRHGLTSVSPVLPGVESLEAWEAHRAAVVGDLAPVGYVEMTIANRAASLLWRLERVTRYETEHVASGIEAAQHDIETRGFKVRTRDQIAEVLEGHQSDARAFARVCKAGSDDAIDDNDAEAVLDVVADGDEYEHELGDGETWTKRALLKAVSAVDEAPYAFECAEAHVKGAAEKAGGELQDFDAEVRRKVRARLLLAGDDRDVTVRYEAHLDRALFKCIRELQRMQAVRGDARVVPLALDAAPDVEQREDAPD